MSSLIGFFGAFTLLFVALKLMDEITWSWLWVLAPAWIPVAFIFLVILILVTKVKDLNKFIKK